MKVSPINAKWALPVAVAMVELFLAVLAHHWFGAAFLSTMAFSVVFDVTILVCVLSVVGLERREVEARIAALEARLSQGCQAKCDPSRRDGYCACGKCADCCAQQV